MRLHLPVSRMPVVVALSVMVCLILALFGLVSANALRVDKEALGDDSRVNNYSIAAAPNDASSSDNVLTGARYVGALQAPITVTVTPTGTPGSSTLMPTPTVTPTLTITPGTTITDIIYVPALLLGNAPGGSGVTGTMCDPVTGVIPSPTAEPTSLPPPTLSTGQSNLTTTVCPPNLQEIELAKRLITSTLQARTSMTYNPILAQVAKEHAYDMAIRDYFGSTNPDGIGPNQRVRNAGYVLPDFYGNGAEANNIESLVAGQPTVQDVYAVLSSNRSPHVFGDGDAYSNQDEYGIGYAYVKGSTYGRYWVIIIAAAGGEQSTDQ